MGSEMKHSFDLKRKNRRDLKRMNRTIGTVHSWANRPPDLRTSTLRRRLATDLARPARAFPFFLATKNHKSHKPDDLLNRAFKLFRPVRLKHTKVLAQVEHSGTIADKVGK